MRIYKILKTYRECASI